MLKSWTFGLVAAASLAFAAIAHAEPIQLQQISADAKWAAHLDVDALMASETIKGIRQKCLENCEQAENYLSMLAAVWRFDPTTDLHGITIYGTQFKPKTGVAIVHANVDQQMLLDKVAQAPCHEAAKYGDFELHSWTHAAGTKHERSMTGTFFKPNIMVFGATPDEVKAALDVLDGSKPSFDGSETGLSLMLPPGTIMTVGAIGLSDCDLPGKSPLAKKINAMVLAIGQEQSDICMAGQVVMKDASLGQEMKSVIDGGLAFAKIAKSNDPELLKLLDAFQVSVADKAVNVEWRAPAEEVFAGLHKAAAEAKKAHKEWQERMKSKSCPKDK